MPHALVRRTASSGPVESGATWGACTYCGCPHGMSDGQGAGGARGGAVAGSYLVALQPKRCPPSFEKPCRYCGETYECRADCAGMAQALATARKRGIHVVGP